MQYFPQCLPMYIDWNKNKKKEIWYNKTECTEPENTHSNNFQSLIKNLKMCVATKTKRT